METELVVYEFASDQPNEIYYTNTKINFMWRCGPTRAMAAPFLGFLDHTQRRITVSGRVISQSQRPLPDNTQPPQKRDTKNSTLYRHRPVPAAMSAVGSSQLGLRVRIPPGTWIFLVSVACCQVEVSASGWSLDQSSTYRLWCVVVCDIETSRMGWPWPALGRCATVN